MSTFTVEKVAPSHYKITSPAVYHIAGYTMDASLTGIEESQIAYYAMRTELSVLILNLAGRDESSFRIWAKRDSVLTWMLESLWFVRESGEDWWALVTTPTNLVRLTQKSTDSFRHIKPRVVQKEVLRRISE